MSLHRLALALGFLVLANTALAETIRVLTLESDAMPGTSTVDIVRNSSGEITGVKGITPEGTLYFTLNQLNTPQVLKQVGGVTALYFSVERDFDPVKGGHANLRFLQNGVTKAYRNFRVDMETAGQDMVLRSQPNYKDYESDRNPYTTQFNYLYLKANTLLGRPIGIKNVVPEMR